MTGLFLSGCAVYKQLTPEPGLSPQEQGFLELKAKDKNLVLKKEKKYYIAFPAPAEKNFYLVLKITDKDKIQTSLTAKLDKESIPGDKIKDNAYDPKTMSVYPVTSADSVYYWLIEGVPQEMALQLEYRYVPQWRFKWENRHAELRQAFRQNVVDHNIYRTIGVTFHFEGFDFKKVTDSVSNHLAELKKAYAELMDIESIFPPSILNSKDQAYQDFVILKKQFEAEIAFQGDYLFALDFFRIEIETRGDHVAFMDHVNDFLSYFRQKDRLIANVVQEAQTLLTNRLNLAVAFFDIRLKEKNDATPLDKEYYRTAEIRKTDSLWMLAGTPISESYSAFFRFVTSFDDRGTGLIAAREETAKINAAVVQDTALPADDYFASVRAKAAAVAVPEKLGQEFGKYAGFICTGKLNAAIDLFRADVNRAQSQYALADSLVRQVNAFRAQKDHSSALGILKQNLSLTFLVDKYRSLDRISVEEQARTVRASLANAAWGGAETGLFKLNRDKNFIDMPKIAALKEQTVSDLEDSLYIKVDLVTRQRVDAFCEEQWKTLDNVDSLYTDSVFLPVHDITFSSGSKTALVQRKEKLVAHLAKLKENEFPEKAIKLLYDEFLKNPDDSGVLKARAVVVHGAHYKGTDRDIAMRVAECNPKSAKLISKPTVYRRVFALPTTDKRQGKNLYFVRLNINIDSEAKFPVYDINIKLPKEVAQNAAAAQWYEKLMMNNKLLKNEGRFTISAPTAASNWECQITPVQMVKDKGNYLDIYFYHNSFKAFALSVMAQKPIIKKN